MSRILIALLSLTILLSVQASPTSKKVAVDKKAPRPPIAKTVEIPKPSSQEVNSSTRENSILLSGMPLIFFLTYLDSRLQYERIIKGNYSLLVGLTYKYESFSDARIPNNSSAYGPNIYLRLYFMDSYFTQGGIEYLKVYIENTRNHSEKDGDTLAIRALVGKRFTLQNSLVFEAALGATYYTHEVKEPVDQCGYAKGAMPAFHLGLAVLFKLRI